MKRKCHGSERSADRHSDQVGSINNLNFGWIIGAGFVLGALYGIAWGFWSKTLR